LYVDIVSIAAGSRLYRGKKIVNWLAVTLLTVRLRRINWAFCRSWIFSSTVMIWDAREGQLLLEQSEEAFVTATKGWDWSMGTSTVRY
jgi:hypothetical protein